MGMMPYEHFYDYSFAEPAVDSVTAGIGGFLLVFFLLFYVIMLGFAVVCYVLNALGFYTAAKRRGIRNPWLSWIPIANMWILGSLSDQYQYVVKGKVRNRRKVLIGLDVGIIALILPMIVSFIVAVLGDYNALVGDMLFGSAIAVFLLCYFAMMIVAVLLAVFVYIAYYDYLVSCDPGNAVLYLVLSIIIPVTLPFFVFFSRKKDLGMPPRKQKTPPAIELFNGEPAGDLHAVVEDDTTDTPVQIEE